MKADVVIDADSELHITGCQCQDQFPSNACMCPLYFSTLRGSINKNAGLKGTQKLCKREADMAVMDWVIHGKSELLPGDSVASIITSANIDAVVIHLFCLPLQWPRDTWWRPHAGGWHGGLLDTRGLTGPASVARFKYNQTNASVLPILLDCSLSSNLSRRKFTKFPYWSEIMTWEVQNSCYW